MAAGSRVGIGISGPRWCSDDPGRRKRPKELPVRSRRRRCKHLRRRFRSGCPFGQDRLTGPEASGWEGGLSTSLDDMAAPAATGRPQRCPRPGPGRRPSRGVGRGAGTCQLDRRCRPRRSRARRGRAAARRPRSSRGDRVSAAPAPASAVNGAIIGPVAPVVTALVARASPTKTASRVGTWRTALPGVWPGTRVTCGLPGTSSVAPSA